MVKYLNSANEMACLGSCDRYQILQPKPVQHDMCPFFCLLLRVSSDYAQPVTGHVTEVTCPVIGRAQPEFTPSKKQKTDPANHDLNVSLETAQEGDAFELFKS